MQYIKIFLVALPSFLILDGLWLGLVAKNFYQKHLGYLMGPVNWVPVTIFYILYIIGMSFLVIQPALQSNSIVKALVGGLLLGMCAYAAYDLTNHSIIKDWPWIVSLVDIIWGMIGSAIVATLTYYVINKFL